MDVVLIHSELNAFQNEVLNLFFNISINKLSTRAKKNINKYCNNLYDSDKIKFIKRRYKF